MAEVFIGPRDSTTLHTETPVVNSSTPTHQQSAINLLLPASPPSCWAPGLMSLSNITIWGSKNLLKSRQYFGMLVFPLTPSTETACRSQSIPNSERKTGNATSSV